MYITLIHVTKSIGLKGIGTGVTKVVMQREEGSSAFAYPSVILS